MYLDVVVTYLLSEAELHKSQRAVGSLSFCQTSIKEKVG